MITRRAALIGLAMPAIIRPGILMPIARPRPGMVTVHPRMYRAESEELARMVRRYAAYLAGPMTYEESIAWLNRELQAPADPAPFLENFTTG